MRARRTAGARSPPQRIGVDGQQARATLRLERVAQVVGGRVALAGPADLGDEHPRSVQERHQHRRDGDRADGGDQPTDRGQPRPDATSERDSRPPRLASGAARRRRARACVRAPRGSRLRRAGLGLQLHRSRSIASSMSRAISSAKGRPASSACFGYMLVAVKPGSVFISDRYVSSGVTRKSIRASPAASTAR